VRIDEMAQLATQRLPPPVAEFFNQGAGPGLSTSEATAAWDRIRFRPRMLRGVSDVSTAVSVLGQQLDTPILVAPTAMQRAAHPDGELATARSTAACGSLMELSTNSGWSFADIAATGSPWWLQLYVMRDRGLATTLVEAAKQAGASAVVLTVDTPVVGRKYNAGQTIYEVSPDEFFLVNLDRSGLPERATEQADDLTPDDIGKLRAAAGLPVVVKGVLRGDDARDFVAAGAAAVQVSNHGGRQLDMAVPTAEALPEIVAAVEGTGAEVYVDGGIRRAEHVLAALALGARAVFLGRPVLWALAAGGESAEGGTAGVTSLLAELTNELRHAMKLAGTRRTDEIGADLVRRPA
jgi:4-hydroxymandelate oxidase